LIPSIYPRLRLFARFLEWENLQEYRHKAERTVPNLRKGQIIRCWCSGSYEDLALHINENPPWYACVYALRYRICTGWHWLYPYKDQRKLMREAKRLYGLLGRSWFTSAQRRREFRLIHPECADYSWSRLRKEGPPHYYDLGGKKRGTKPGQVRL